MASPQNPIPAEVPLSPARDPVWTGRDVVALVLIAFFTLIFCGVVIGVYVAAVYPKQKPEEVAGMPVISILAQTVTSALVLAAMYWMVVRRYRSRFWSAVRWSWPAHQHALLYAFGGVTMALLVDLASSLAPMPKSLPIYKLFGTTASAYALAAYGVLVAPWVEELFFRGFLYPVLARRLGLPAAVLLASFAFMLIHISQLGGAWLPLLILFCVGTIFTLARAWTGSVAVPFVIHTFYNATLFAGLFFSTGYFRHMERMTQ
ncbi:MAG: lysostaphin resistance A-like protein [Terriglobales bacterium]